MVLNATVQTTCKFFPQIISKQKSYFASTHKKRDFPDDEILLSRFRDNSVRIGPFLTDIDHTMEDVAIVKPELQTCKVSHYGSKQL